MPRLVPLAVPCLIALCCLPAHADEDKLKQDESALRNAAITPDGPGLLAFLRQHTTTENDESDIKQLVRSLGDDRFRTRERASGTLVSLGTKALPFLRTAVSDPDLEVSRRAQRCLEQITQGAAEALLGSAIRLLSARKIAGADRAILDFAAGADKEYLIDAALEGLAGFAVSDGKANPVLVEALAGKSGERRAIAGVVLARTGAKDAQPAVRKLLADPKPAVRLRVGLALAGTKDKEAVLPLIQLLSELPAGDMGMVEDLLYRLAGEDAPDSAPGTSAEERKKYQAAWEKWHAANREKIDLAKLGEAAKPRGHTLVVLLDANRIVYLGADKKPLWQIDGVNFPLDAQLLPGERVLAAEYQGNRVSERNKKGEVLWEKQIAQPIVAQRLPNGNTFIATAGQLLEVDRTGKEVWTQPPPQQGRVMKATRLRNGNVATIVMMGGVVTRLVEITREGKEVRNFAVEQRTSGGRVEMTANGNVLLCERDTNRIIEKDNQGKIVWEASFDQPVAAVRLPNGNTLVTSMSQQRAVELDGKGKEVWEYRTTTRVTRAWRY